MFEIIILLLLLIYLCITYYYFKFAVVRRTTPRFSESKYRNSEKYKNYADEIIENIKWYREQNTEEIKIKSDDGVILVANYFSGLNSSKTIILFHGYHSTAYNDFSGLIRYYHEKNYNLIIVDQRAHGRSEGKYIGFGVLEKFDCVQWIDYINNNYNLPDVFLYGVSMGATTVLMAAGLGLPKNVKGIISDCGFTSIKELFAKILIKDFKISKFPIYYMASIMSKVLAGYYFKDGSTVEAVKNSKIPLLIFHGGNDSLIPKNMSKSIYDASVSEYKRICIIENADHAECYASDSIKYEHESIGFLNRIA